MLLTVAWSGDLGVVIVLSHQSRVGLSGEDHLIKTNELVLIKFDEAGSVASRYRGETIPSVDGRSLVWHRP